MNIGFLWIIFECITRQILLHKLVSKHFIDIAVYGEILQKKAKNMEIKWKK